MAERRDSLAQARTAAGYTQESLAEALGIDWRSVRRWETGHSTPQPHRRAQLAKLLNCDMHQINALLANKTHIQTGEPDELHTSDEIAALELARRVTSSDIGNATLVQLEEAFDSLAIDYQMVSPEVLLPRIRGHIGYVTQLMDSRKTLAEHVRLTAIGGWLSLLAATVNIDLKRYDVATANLKTASTLAKDIDNFEIRAWCYETAAWRALTDGDYRAAVELSQAAQSLAPSGSSIAIQSAAQEGRALARLGKSKETYEAVNRVHNLVSKLPYPDRPEHHYRYDPNKSTSYTATTLAWLGDPAAETYAREVIARLSPSQDPGKWPRRLAMAKLDLSLALIAGNQLDEASVTAQEAILSGRIIPSNRWRAAEIVCEIETRSIAEAADLRDAFETLR